MTTLDDLREALASDEQQTFDHDKLLAGVRRGVARRRLLRTSGVVAAVLLVSMAGLTVTGLPNPNRIDDTAAPPRPPLSFTIRPSTVDGYEITPSMAMVGRQDATVRRPDGSRTQKTGISVYDPGAYDPTYLRSGEPVTVGGRPGFYRVARGSPMIHPVGTPTDNVTPYPLWFEVGWEYAADAWAVLVASSMTKDAMVRLAAGVILGDPVPGRVPVKTGYLPAGLGAVMLHQSRTVVRPETVTDWSTWLLFDRAGAVPDPDRELQQPLRIVVYPGGGDAPVSGVWTPNAVVAGHPAFVQPGQIQVNFGTFWVFVVGYGPGTEEVAELERVVAGLTLAPSADPATWFDL